MSVQTIDLYVMAGPRVELRVEPPRVTTVVTGGARGRPGAVGPPGGEYLEHLQDTPAATWTVTTGFGRYAHVTVLDDTGAEILATVEQPDSNHVVVVHASPRTGRVVATA